MKKIMITCLLLVLVMAAIPAITLSGIVKPDNRKPDAAASEVLEASQATEATEKATEKPTEKATEKATEKPTEKPAGKADAQSFKILDNATGDVLQVSDRDFCIGALAAEMPASFEEEALKAQCTALYTFFCKKRDAQREKTDSNLKGADFSCNSEKKEVYIPKETLQSLWKDNFETAYKKLENAVNAVFSQVIRYDGELITAAYCAISGGITEKRKNALSEDQPYLQSVASPWDALCNEYLSTVTLTNEEVKTIIEDTWNDITLGDSSQEWFTDLKTTDAGTVSSVKVGGKEVTGQEIRDAFSLRSSNFEVLYTLDEFVFTVRGYGHGAGLSQYGANEMAKQGADYQEILAWYYPGTTIETL